LSIVNYLVLNNDHVIN